MKSKLTQRRIKARKASACGLCKPLQQGGVDKKTVRDFRHAVRAEQQLRELARQCAKVKPPPLKSWTKTSLTERDWNFLGFYAELDRAVSMLPDAKAPFLVARAFDWELDRELGSGNEPFNLAREFEHEPADDPRQGQILIMRRDHPTIAVAIPEPPPWLLWPELRNDRINEWPVAELAWYLPPDASLVSRGSNDICALEIPWTVNEEDVVEAFRAWLRWHRGKHTEKAGRNAGRKHEWRTWFRDLALYRLAEAGYTRKEVLKMLAEASKKSTPQELSPQNFARAKRLIREKANRRFRTMLYRAKSMEKDHPGMGFGNWRRWFVKYATAKTNSPCQQSPPDS